MDLDLLNTINVFELDALYEASLPANLKSTGKKEEQNVKKAKFVKRKKRLNFTTLDDIRFYITLQNSNSTKVKYKDWGTKCELTDSMLRFLVS